MRIISDFRDYYDSVQSQGFDNKVVYRRATRDYVHQGLDATQHWRTHTGAEAEAVQAEMALLPDFHDLRPRPFAKDGFSWVSSQAEAGMLYLAGRAYPFWRLFAERNGPATTSLEPGFGEHVMQDKKPRRPYRWEGDTTDYTPWEEWLEAHWGREIDPAIHFLHGSPMVLYVGDRRIIDPCLKDHGFQRRLDPFTVFQELDMFLGGVMAEAVDAPSPQTDKEKIASHGMDVKRSFRKMPRP